jgi:NitT/TauT family transport system substrate-binding protein
MREPRSLARRRALAVFGAGVAAPRLVRAQTLLTIKVGHPITETATPLVYAMRAGLLERAGIKVELSKFASGAAVSAAVAGGALDLGGTSLLALIVGHARSIPFTIVAAANNMFTAASEVGVFVQAAAPLRDAKDFNGKTISAAAVGDIVSIMLWAWMEQNGADWRSLKVVEIPQPAAAAALETGRFDGSVLTGTWYAAAEADPKLRVAARIPTAIGPRYASTAWFSTRDWVTKNHPATERFARVMSEAAAYTNAHPAETLDDLVSFTGTDRAVAAKMKRATFSTTLSAADIQPIVDAAVKYRIIDRTFNAAELLSDTVPR